MSGTENTYTTSNNRTLVAVSSGDGTTPVNLWADPATHGLVVSATISSAGLATSANQTNGTQLTQIVDAGGDAVTVTGGKLDVNATATLAGTALPISAATTAVGVAIVDGSGNQITSFGGGTQYADGAARGTATGTIAMVDDGTNIQSAKGDTDGTQQINATKLVGTAIDVNSGSKSAGTQRIVIATDQPQLTNAFKVDGSAVTQPVSGTFFQATQPVSGVVTIGAGSAVIGHVITDTGSTTAVTGTVTVSATNLSTNLAQVAGATTQTGHGTASGALRVELPTDGTGVIAAVTAITNALPVGTNSIGKISDITTSITPGTGAANLGKAEDSAHTTGDVGVLSLAVRNDAGAVLANADLDYVPISTDATGAVRVDLNGTVSTNNSSTAVLAGGAVFTGTWEDVLNYNEIRVSVVASHVSASDGLSIQQSSDGTNIDFTDTYTIPAATGKTYSVPRQARYYRAVYTNGATLQTSFRLQTILNRLGTKASSQRPNDAYTNETDLEQEQSFLMGYNGTTWDRLRTTGTGVLTVSSVLTAGSAVIGKVSIDQTTPGTTNLVALAANQSVNNAQINGVTPLMGNGVTGTGSQRVTIASDNTAFSVNATLSAETTKVIGTVNQGTNPWVTSNATTSVVGNGAAATAQRVTLANDSTGIIATVGAVTAITNALPAGSNAIGKLAANSGVIIGDVNIVSNIPGTGATNLGKAEDAGHTSSDTGVFVLGVRNDNAATTVTNANADYSQFATDATGTEFVRISPSNTSTVSNVASSATSVTLIAANAARRLFTCYNDSTSDAYVKFGTTASSTSFNLYLPSLGSFSLNGEDYAGRVDIIWISANGNARICETTI